MAFRTGCQWTMPGTGGRIRSCWVTRHTVGIDRLDHNLAGSQLITRYRAAIGWIDWWTNEWFNWQTVCPQFGNVHHFCASFFTPIFSSLHEKLREKLLFNPTNRHPAKRNPCDLFATLSLSAFWLQIVQYSEVRSIHSMRFIANVCTNEFPADLNFKVSGH